MCFVIVARLFETNVFTAATVVLISYFRAICPQTLGVVLLRGDYALVNVGKKDLEARPAPTLYRRKHDSTQVENRSSAEPKLCLNEGENRVGQEGGGRRGTL